jgi:alcohol dehydrogenase
MLSKTPFRVQPIPRLIFGLGTAAELAKHVGALGCSEALIVTDKGLVAAGVIAPLVESMKAGGISVNVFDGIEANPNDRNIEAGVAAAKAMESPAIVAVGGGSSMDGAKAIAIVAANGGSFRDYAPGCKPKHDALPLIAVPTTAGTGSETNMFGLITDTQTHRKTFVAHHSVMPKVSVLDPALGVGLPPKATAMCGFDVFTHALEAYTSRVANPFSDAMSWSAMETAIAWLPRVIADGSDIEGRSQMLLASSMAAYAFNVVGLGACHATGHPISAHLNTPHGQTLATMMPAVMNFNLENAAPKYAKVARLFGAAKESVSDADNARAAIDAIRAFIDSLGLTQRLGDLGVSAELVPTLVEDALADMTLRTNPRKAAAEDVTALYEAAAKA